MIDFDPTEYAPSGAPPQQVDETDHILYHISQKEHDALLNKIKRSYGTLVGFRKEMLSPDPKHEFESAKHHYEWSDILLNGKKHFNIQAYRESAKALPLDTEVPTPEGFKTIAQIQKGDIVYDINGFESSVTAKSPIFIDRKLYRIFFDDGTTVDSDAEHEWYVWDKNVRKFQTRTTEYISKTYRGWAHKNGYAERRYRIPVCGAVPYYAKSVRIHPYVLGFWLGDGTSSGIRFAIGDKDAKEIVALFNRFGYVLEKKKPKCMYSVIGVKEFFWHYNLINNKHIPEIYMHGSIEQRLWLLRGLVDSDGTVASKGSKRGAVSFSNTNEHLAIQVLELVRSLGIKATFVRKNAYIKSKFCGYAYSVSFKTNFRVSGITRKDNTKCKCYARSQAKTIIGVELVSKYAKTQCISVNSLNNTFIVGHGYNVTHNSSLVIRAFPNYRLMFPSKDTRYICLVKRNQELAGDKLLEIEREYRNNPYLKQNIVKIIEESASAFQLVVVDPLTGENIEMRIEAHGKGPTLRGALWNDMRPQILIIDDIQTKDDMDSDKILKRDWQWFLDDVMFLSSYGRIFMISNNLGENCISERIMNTEGHFGFECVRLPRTSALTEEGIPAWPAKEKQSQILAEYERYKAAHEESIWIRNCMCECIGDQDRVFFRDYFQYYPLSTQTKIAHDCNVYIRMDTAVKDKDTSDYTAIVVFGINPDAHTFIFDISFGHYSADKKIDELFRLVSKWRPNNAGIEETNESYQLIKDIKKEMPKRRIFFQLVGLKHCGKRKEIRIETTLQPRYASHTVWHPEEAPWLKELEHELLMFSRSGRRSLKDDVIDAFAYMGQETNVPMRNTRYKDSNTIEVARCDITVV